MLRLKCNDCEHKETLTFQFHPFTKSLSLFKICFLNAQSLHKHIEDVRQDYNFKNVNLLILMVFLQLYIQDYIMTSIITRAKLW